MYGETEEPSASMVVPDDIFQVSTQDLAGYLSFRPKLLLQDPSDIMAVSKRRLNRWVRRMIHTVVNDRFVRPLAVAVTNLDSAYMAATKTVAHTFRHVQAAARLSREIEEPLDEYNERGESHVEIRTRHHDFICLVLRFDFAVETLRLRETSTRDVSK